MLGLIDELSRLESQEEKSIPDMGKSRKISGKWEIKEEKLHQELEGPCHTILFEEFALKNGVIEVEANSLDGIGGQHLVWRSDSYRNNCYMFGSVGVGQNPYAHFWLWKEGERPKNLRIWQKGEIPEMRPKEFHKYKVVFQDNKFKFFIDDVMLGEVEDDTHKDGYVGLHCGSRTVFKNIKAKELK